MFNFLKKNKWDKKIYSPVKGKSYELSKVDDPVFAQKMVGDGLAIKPTGTEIYAPISGQLKTVFATKHAYGIVNSEGLSVLIHIGLDTAQLEGQGFTCFVKQNQKVKRGDLLVKVDFNLLKKKIKSYDVIVLVSPESKLKASKIITNKTINKDTVIMEI